MRTSATRKRLLASTMITGTAMVALMAFPAAAQTASPQEDPTEIDEVVVTGSRLARQDFTAISPVTTVDAETISLTGTLTVDTLLNELPQVVPGNTRTSNNAGGEDFATIDLRGLGTNRTLVLVNGERVPASSTTGVVDINTIPASLISRVEVVTGGASAVYGSDAVAGVVNFILKDDYEGAEMSITHGASFDGLAPEFEINTLFGGNFASGRGNLTAYASYYSREKVGQDERDFSRVSGAVFQDGAGNIVVADTTQEALDIIAGGGARLLNGGSITPPWGVIPGGQGFQNLATILPTQFGAGTYDTNCDGVANTAAFNSGQLTFDPQGRLSPYQNAGGSACGVPSRSGIRDGIRGGSSRYSFAEDNYLITPAERFNLTTIGTYDITDNVRAKVQLNFSNSTQEVQLAATPAGPGTEITVTPTPAMLALILANAPDLHAAILGRVNPTAPFLMYRRFNEVGTRNGFSESNSFSLLSTLEGEFNDNWSWSATGSYGSNKFTSVGLNSVNSTALNQGLAGCQTAAGAPLGSAALPGCLALDVFGENTLTEAMASFIRVNTFSTTDVEESRLAGFIRGNLFDLPAGPVAVVIGAEYRDSEFQFVVDNEQRTGNIKGFNATQDQGGAINVAELYTEVSVPLLRDLPFASYLGLEGGYRTSDYSSVGRVSTYKIGAEYAPVDWLRFRTIFNEATRAPNVFELFQNGDQGFPSVVDPCVTTTAATLAFCALKAGGFNYTGYTQPNAQVQAFAFGNPNLEPETAETFTIGAVITPTWFPLGNIRATVDYYNIEISNTIGALGASFYLNQCYQTDLSLTSDACSRIIRNPTTGDVVSVDTSRGNLGSQSTEGWDIQVDYSLDLEDVGLPGTLRLNELLSLVDSFEISGTEFVGQNFAGIGGGLFDMKSVFTATYTVSDYLVSWRWSYLPELVSGSFGNTLPDASYVDLSGRWNATENLAFTAFIGNLFDEDTPQISEGALGGQANSDVQVYRVLGRTYSVNAKFRF